MNSRKGFTLIELLLAIAVMAVIAALVISAIDPVTRMKQARDSQRKMEINGIANALRSYDAMYGKYPDDTASSSDTSKGTSGSDWSCGGGAAWSTGGTRLNEKLVVVGGFLRSLPKDPTNNTVASVTYCYLYEPQGPSDTPCTTATGTCRYWIGAKLEKPTVGNTVFRCSDRSELAAGGGCKEVGGWNL